MYGAVVCHTISKGMNFGPVLLRLYSSRMCGNPLHIVVIQLTIKIKLPRGRVIVKLKLCFGSWVSKNVRSVIKRNLDKQKTL